MKCPAGREFSPLKTAKLPTSGPGRGSKQEAAAEVWVLLRSLPPRAKLYLSAWEGRDAGSEPWVPTPSSTPGSSNQPQHTPCCKARRRIA